MTRHIDESGSSTKVSSAKRTKVWVIRMWSQANLQEIVVSDLSLSGRMIQSGQLRVVWKTPEHTAFIEERVAWLSQGCACKT